MKKLTKEEFIERSKIIHGNKYDYSKVEYVDRMTKVCIICPVHGEFWQSPKNHLHGWGCQVCANDKRTKINTGTKEKFICKARELHGDKYDYSKVEYKGYNIPVCIICPVHGEFWQTPTKHLNSLGCKECTRKNTQRRDSLEEFIAKSKLRHGDKFDYSKTVYVDSNTKVIVTCPIHGDIEITPHNHLHAAGCPQCAKEKRNADKESRKKEKEEKKEKKKLIKKTISENSKIEFIRKAREIHGDKYDYSKVEYINSNTKVCIICPEHGKFWQSPKNHIARRSGCPKCAIQRQRERFTFTKEKFIENARRIHGDKYDYSKVEYINNRTKVCIICPEHGKFWQTPAMHFNEAQGCPECGTLSSKGESEVLEFIKELLPNIEIVQREHTIIRPQELDIYIPSLKVAIEYDGLRWHSELFDKDKFFHITKTVKCEEKGIRLIHIFEDEWVYRKEIVKDKIRQILLCGNNKKIYARNCTVREIPHNVSENFLSQNHIQGGVIATVHLGLFYNDELVSVMTFIRRNDEWELNRFATLLHHSIVGAGGKLFTHFTRKYNPSVVKSFADLRWSSKNNNIYEKIGFKQEVILPPNYTYVTTKNSFRKRYHKFNFRKQTIHKKYELPLTMTESEMAKELGYYKIWDCGLIKYIWRK